MWQYLGCILSNKPTLIKSKQTQTDPSIYSSILRVVVAETPTEFASVSDVVPKLKSKKFILFIKMMPFREYTMYFSAFYYLERRVLVKLATTIYFLLRFSAWAYFFKLKSNQFTEKNVPLIMHKAILQFIITLVVSWNKSSVVMIETQLVYYAFCLIFTIICTYIESLGWNINFIPLQESTNRKQSVGSLYSYNKRNKTFYKQQNTGL